MEMFLMHTLMEWNGLLRNNVDKQIIITYETLMTVINFKQNVKEVRKSQKRKRKNPIKKTNRHIKDVLKLVKWAPFQVLT